jgi:hypothetical protein
VVKRTPTKISEFTTAQLPDLQNAFEPAVSETHRENAEERIRALGPGFEMVRQAYVARLKGHVPAFYEHGSLPDLVALCDAFEEWAKSPPVIPAPKWERAILVESLLKTLKLSRDTT